MTTADVAAGIYRTQEQMRDSIMATAKTEGWPTLRLVRVLDALQLRPLPKTT